MKLFIGLFFVFSNLSFGAEIKEVSSQSFNLQTIFQDKAKNVVWSFAFLNKDELLVTLRSGELLFFNQKTKETKKLKAPLVEATGQGGLLDVHVKDIKGQRYIYLTFSEKLGKTVTTSLARGEFVDKKIKNLKTLFQAKVQGDGDVHFGSRLLFTGKRIFMTIGERGERKFAQDLKFHNGKILRLTLEGKPAKGNPFENKNNALAEIWSYGHRNPQGIDLHPKSIRIYSSEFGPRGGDELNLIRKGKNYGWPEITYGKEYWGPSIGQKRKKAMEQPVEFWVPSISPSGMVFYRGDKFPHWKDSLFLANLGSRHLRRLVLKGRKVVSQEILFKDLGERIRHVRNAPDGYLYFSTDSGKIIKVTEGTGTGEQK